MEGHLASPKPFRWFWNRSQATAPNVYLLLYPRAPLRSALAGRPALFGQVFEALPTLNMEALKSEGRVYGGGLFKLEPRELANLPARFLVERVGLVDHLAQA